MRHDPLVGDMTQSSLTAEGPVELYDSIIVANFQTQLYLSQTSLCRFQVWSFRTTPCHKVGRG